MLPNDDAVSNTDGSSTSIFIISVYSTPRAGTDGFIQGHIVDQERMMSSGCFTMVKHK